MRSSRTRCAGFGLLAAALSATVPARAADDAPKGNDNPVIVSWSAPGDGDCPDASYVPSEVRRHVGPARADRQTIRASVVIRSAGTGTWQMVLKTEQGTTQGERILRDASCRAISDAAVVVLAWMIDPNAMAESSRPAPPPAPPPPPAPEPPPKLQPKAPPSRSVVPFVGLAVAADAGTLPAAASGGEVRAGAMIRPARVAAYGAFWPNATKIVGTLADGTAVGGDFALLAFGLQACFEAAFSARPDGAVVAFCAGPELDVMRGRGFGVNAPGEGTKAWVSAVAGAEGAVPLGGPWRVTVRVAAVLPQRREHFALQGIGEVHQAAFVSGRAGLGLELVF